MRRIFMLNVLRKQIYSYFGIFTNINVHTIIKNRLNIESLVGTKVKYSKWFYIQRLFRYLYE